MNLSNTTEERGRERRAHPRISEKNSVAVKVLSCPDDPSLVKKVFFCATEDLSVGGVKLQLSKEVPVGTRLELRVAVSRPYVSFRHVGRVVWVKKQDMELPYATGIQFSSPPGDGRTVWKQFIADKLK